MEIARKLLSGEKSISTSALKTAKKSTRDLIHYYEKPKDKKLYFDFGNLAELWFIDKVEFKKVAAIMDETKRPEPLKNYQTKVNKEWKDKFYEDNADKYIIPAIGKDSFEVILTLEKLAESHPAFGMLFGKDMIYQDAFEWTCQTTGLKRYSRTDLYSKSQGIIVDIKTDGDNDFERSCRTNDYFLQAIDQIEGALCSGKMDVVKEYYWFVLGKSEPYFIDVYKFDFENALKVEEVYRSTLMRIKRDLEEGVENIVWHEAPITIMKCPSYYK